jgi:hypothetical protein
LPSPSLLPTAPNKAYITSTKFKSCVDSASQNLVPPKKATVRMSNHVGNITSGFGLPSTNHAIPKPLGTNSWQPTTGHAYGSSVLPLLSRRARPILLDSHRLPTLQNTVLGWNHICLCFDVGRTVALELWKQLEHAKQFQQRNNPQDDADNASQD